MAFIEFETEDAYNEAVSAKVNEAVEAAINDKNQGWLPERLKKAHDNAVEETKAQYADYDQLKEASAGFEKERKAWEESKASYESKIKGYETQNTENLKLRAAMKYGLSADDATRLRGDTEKDIDADAKQFAEAHKITGRAYPPKDREGGDVDGVTAAFRKLNPNIKF